MFGTSGILRSKGVLDMLLQSGDLRRNSGFQLELEEVPALTHKIDT